MLVNKSGTALLRRERWGAEAKKGIPSEKKNPRACQNKKLHTRGTSKDWTSTERAPQVVATKSGKQDKKKELATKKEKGPRRRSLAKKSVSFDYGPSRGEICLEAE